MIKSHRSIIPYSAAAIIVILISVFAAFLTPFDPYAQNLDKALMPPNVENLLGTDRYGRDLLSRIIMGSQTTVLGALSVIFTVSVIGVVVGSAAGFKGGKLDSLLMRLGDVFLAFPQMVFAIFVAGVLGGGLINAALAVALIAWPKYARIARNFTLTVKNMPYIEAARISGANNFIILKRHILPNILGPIFVTAALDVGTIIMELAGLSFLGIGAQPPTAEWGSMMSNGRSMLQTAPWVVLAPGFAIFITVAVFNLFGDKLRDVLDSRN
ncbi:MAG: ABC transporter permease [Selenomonadaceae bacterium]|nr:ABC transporter permease [Selenomonadaceae bacterium]